MVLEVEKLVTVPIALEFDRPRINAGMFHEVTSNHVMAIAQPIGLNLV